MPKLCVLTQYFPPEMGAPQARLFESSTFLQEFGWEVEVLTALPNYPSGRIFQGYVPTEPIVETVGSIRTDSCAPSTGKARIRETPAVLLNICCRGEKVMAHASAKSQICCGSSLRRCLSVTPPDFYPVSGVAPSC